MWVLWPRYGSPGVAAILISGGPRSWDDLERHFEPCKLYNDWPHFENARGVHLFRQVGEEEWHLSREFKPGQLGFENPRIASPGGELPIGGDGGVWTFWNEGCSVVNYSRLCQIESCLCSQDSTQERSVAYVSDKTRVKSKTESPSEKPEVVKQKGCC